jgi:hypothetical protein
MATETQTETMDKSEKDTGDSQESRHSKYVNK